MILSATTYIYEVIKTKQFCDIVSTIECKVFNMWTNEEYTTIILGIVYYISYIFYRYTLHIQAGGYTGYVYLTLPIPCFMRDIHIPAMFGWLVGWLVAWKQLSTKKISIVRVRYYSQSKRFNKPILTIISIFFYFQHVKCVLL